MKSSLVPVVALLLLSFACQSTRKGPKAPPETINNLDQKSSEAGEKKTPTPMPPTPMPPTETTDNETKESIQKLSGGFVISDRGRVFKLDSNWKLQLMDGLQGDAGSSGDNNPIAYGSCFINKEQALFCWQADTSPERVKINQPLVEISSSNSGSFFALDANGEIWAWGEGSKGVFMNGNSDPIAQSTPIRIVRGQQFKQLVARLFNVCAIKSGGDLYCWGSKAFARLGNAAGGTDEAQVTAADESVKIAESVTSLASTAEWACFSNSNGEVSCWGNRSLGIFGDGLDDRGSQVAKPEVIAGVLKIKEVKACGDGLCALDTDGALHFWGDAGFGKVKPSVIRKPDLVAPGKTFQNIAANSYGVCGLTSDKRIFCWSNFLSKAFQGQEVNLP